MRICLVLEGSYPYVHGGVSTWMHAYIQAMPWQEFSLWVIGAKAQDRGKFVYELPPNGKEAVDIFEAGEAGFFDLILMDIQMPEMDGYEAARRIRQSSHPDAKTITIIAVTANAFQEDLDRALAAGMNDAVTKPLDVAALIDKISRIEKGEQI